MSTPPRTTIRILMVEDSADDAELAALALRRAGLAFTLVCVESEGPFLAALAAPPDIVLCDFHVPGFDCERALKCIEARGLRIPLVVVSRHISDAELDRVMRLGAAGFVHKSRLGDLAGAIGESLREAAATELPPGAQPQG